MRENTRNAIGLSRRIAVKAGSEDPEIFQYTILPQLSVALVASTQRNGGTSSWRDLPLGSQRRLASIGD